MKRLILALLLSACGDLSPVLVDEVPDAGTDTQPQCTQWGVDGKGGRWCMSTDPVACPGPWPCK